MSDIFDKSMPPEDAVPSEVFERSNYSQKVNTDEGLELRRRDWFDSYDGWDNPDSVTLTVTLRKYTTFDGMISDWDYNVMNNEMAGPSYSIGGGKIYSYRSIDYKGDTYWKRSVMIPFYGENAWANISLLTGSDYSVTHYNSLYTWFQDLITGIENGIYATQLLPPSLVANDMVKSDSGVYTMKGEVTDMGDYSSFDVWFEYRFDDDMGWTSTVKQTVSDIGDVSQNINIDTDYTDKIEYRLVCDYSTSPNSIIYTVQTEDPEPTACIVETLFPADVTGFSATIKGKLTRLCSSEPTYVWFLWGLGVNSLTQQTDKVQVDSLTDGDYEEFACELTGFNPGTQVFYRACCNDQGSDSIQTFYTVPYYDEDVPLPEDEEEDENLDMILTIMPMMIGVMMISMMGQMMQTQLSESRRPIYQGYPYQEYEYGEFPYHEEYRPQQWRY